MKKLFAYLSLMLGSAAAGAAYAEIQLQALNLPEIGQIRQMALDDTPQLWLINERGELWQAFPPKLLRTEVSPHIAPAAAHGKVALAEQNGNFLWLEADKIYRSNIALAPKAGMVVLPFAVIAVAEQAGQQRLVRIEPQGDKAEIVATADTPVLPDAQPLQIHFTGDNRQGHIAVLAQPDAHTYQHGVLGDGIEAAEVQFLERHSLQPLAKSLRQKGLVFEANRLEILPHTQGNDLLSVISGNGAGARAVQITLQNKALQIVAQSAALPENRWQSPFVFQQTLYAVQMPHLKGHLVAYQRSGEHFTEHLLGQGLSNHAIGSFETNLAASSRDFALIPHKDYRHISILNKENRLQAVAEKLPAKIIKTLGAKDKVYLLLENGELWQAQ